MWNAVKVVVVVVAFVVAAGLARPNVAHAIERQQAMNWCWASAIQDVVRLRGGSVTQVQVASVLDGSPRDRPATSPEVVAVLHALRIPAAVSNGGLSPQQLFYVLSHGGSVIVLADPSGGAEGHFMVIEAYDAPHNMLVVADPASGTTALVTISQVFSWNWLQSVIAG